MTAAASPKVTTTSRRRFLRGAASVAGAASAVALSPQLAFATPTRPAQGDTLVVIFLRGAADGLTFTPPVADALDSYRAARPTLSMTPDQSLPLDSSNLNAVFPQGLDGIIGLHPAFTGLHQTAWAAGNMAILPAIGVPDSESRSRSHFEAQSYWERGTASKQTTTGWLARVHSALGAAGPVAGMSTDSNSTESLRGSPNTFNITNLENFGISGFRDTGRATNALSQMYQGPGLVNTAGLSSVNVAGMISALNVPDGGYPDSRLGDDLKDVATMIRADLGLVTATISSGGWDHHSDQGDPFDPNGRILPLMSDLGASLSAFYDDLGDAAMNEVTVAVISEFGRTFDENGSFGTDHGRGGTMFLIGGGIQGGVFGNDYITDFGAIDPSGPDRRALPVLTDFRQPLSEVLTTRVGIGNVFPTYAGAPILGVAP